MIQSTAIDFLVPNATELSLHPNVRNHPSMRHSYAYTLANHVKIRKIRCVLMNKPEPDSIKPKRSDAIYFFSLYWVGNLRAEYGSTEDQNAWLIFVICF
jgi:hypothetical protein